MTSIKQKIFAISLSIAMVIGAISSISFSSVYATGDNHKNNDNVKVDCNDVAITLATLYLALGDLDQEGLDELEDELNEGEIAGSIDEIIDDFQNVLDEVNDECEDIDFIGFVDFEDLDLARD